MTLYKKITYIIVMSYVNYYLYNVNYFRTNVYYINNNKYKIYEDPDFLGFLCINDLSQNIFINHKDIGSLQLINNKYKINNLLCDKLKEIEINDLL